MERLSSNTNFGCENTALLCSYATSTWSVDGIECDRR